MKSFVQSILNKFGYQISRTKKMSISPSNFGKTNQLTREIWLEKTLLSIPAGSRILDAGAGELQYKHYCRHLNYVSQDFALYNGIGNQSGLQTGTWDNTGLDIISDITAIPEPDNSFDAIMCIEVFEHLPSPLEALKEFSRLLCKDGTLIITAPFCSLTHFAPYHFYSGFSKYFYEKHLSESGFIIKEIVPNGNFFEYIAQELQFRLPSSYSSHELTSSEKMTITKMVSILEIMSKKDLGSSELLCFGYQCQAIKK